MVPLVHQQESLSAWQMILRATWILLSRITYFVTQQVDAAEARRKA